MRDVDIFKTENNLMSFFIKVYNYTLFSSSLEFNCIKPNSGKNSMVFITSEYNKRTIVYSYYTYAYITLGRKYCIN